MAPDRSTEVCAIDNIASRMDELPDGAMEQCSYQAPPGAIPDILPQRCVARILRQGNYVCFGDSRQICIHALVACAKRGDPVPMPRYNSRSTDPRLELGA